MTEQVCATCRDHGDCDLEGIRGDGCGCWRYPVDFTLRECPFCGNPAEICDWEPYEWNPNVLVKAIRCSNQFGCPGHKAVVTFHPDDKFDEQCARQNWNRRKRKNKLTWCESGEQGE